MTDFTFRAVPIWPYPRTIGRRSRWTFKAPWSDTLRLLQHEILNLNGREAIIGAGFQEGDLRRDGLPRSDAREPSHPGVEVSFYSGMHGKRLIYATDVCEDWRHNVRSIALGLGALRAVDRYGITRRGEQYAGFMALESGGPSIDAGRRLVEEAGGILEALRKYHPDLNNGEDRAFMDVQAYRASVGGGR